MKITTVNGNVIVTAVEQQKDEIPQNVENVQNDLATMVFESMQDKMKINQLETDLGNAVIEIMNIKMGVI